MHAPSAFRQGHGWLLCAFVIIIILNRSLLYWLLPSIELAIFSSSSSPSFLRGERGGEILMCVFMLNKEKNRKAIRTITNTHMAS